METRIDFLSWLSKKLYLTSIGMYATVGSIMVLPIFLTRFFGIQPLVASFTTFFVIAFLRAGYESVIVYEAPIKDLSLHKMLILSLATSSVMAITSYYLKPEIGYFSIPVAILISIKVVAQLKTILWGTHERSGFFAKLPEKLDLNKYGMYGFYIFLVGITYFGYGKYGFDFNYAFTAAFFVGMTYEEIYNVLKIYNQTLTIKSLISTILWAATCSFTASAIVWAMIGFMHVSGQPATIISVVVVKLIQPLGSRKFILGV